MFMACIVQNFMYRAKHIQAKAFVGTRGGTIVYGPKTSDRADKNSVSV